MGPWAIATTYKGDKFDNCTMSRSAESVGSIFVRNRDGLLLLPNSQRGSWIEVKHTPFGWSPRRNLSRRVP